MTFPEDVAETQKLRKGELTMRVGVSYFPTDYGIDIRELARAAEERGFESLFLPEHTHIPKSAAPRFRAAENCPRHILTCTTRSWRCRSLPG